MKRLASIWCLVLICLLSSITFTRAEDQYPKALGYVNDYSHILSPACRDSLNSLLHSYETRSSNQFVVVITDSSGEGSVEEYAHGLFHQWGIGSKDKDNGLLLIWLRDKHKLRFEVGYGLEAYLTDSRCKAIQLQMAPELKVGHFDAGFTLGINQAIAILDLEIALDTPPKPLTAAELQQQKEDRQRKLAQMKNGLIMGSIFISVMCVIGLIGLLLRRREEKKRRQQSAYDQCLSDLGSAVSCVEAIEKLTDSLIPQLQGVPQQDRLPMHFDGINRCLRFRSGIEPWRLAISQLEKKRQSDGLDLALINADAAAALKSEISDKLASIRSVLRWIDMQAAARESVPSRINEVQQLINQRRGFLTADQEVRTPYQQSVALLDDVRRQSKVNPVDWLSLSADLVRVHELVADAVKASQPKPPVRRPANPRTDRHSDRSSGPGSLILTPDDAVERRRDSGWSAPSDPSPSYDSPSFGGGDSGGGGATTDV